MSSKPAHMEHSTLGEYLREIRIQKGIDLVAVAGETRISIKNLKAIEESDFNVLPAEAFTRGFYILYAKCLSLDPKEVLQMYDSERLRQDNVDASPTLTPKMMAQEVASMAERPAFEPTSFVGMTVILLLLLGAVLCWYFSWNPASYLSQQLRSLEHPQRFEQASTDWDESTIVESRARQPRWQQPVRAKRRGIFHLSYPATATAADINETVRKTPPPRDSSLPVQTQH